MVYIGAHISREKTLIETLNKIKENGGNALQIFVSNPRSIQIRKLNEKFISNRNEIKNYLKINDFTETNKLTKLLKEEVFKNDCEITIRRILR